MKRILALLLTVVMLLTAAPLARLANGEFSPQAQAASYQVGDLITFGSYPQSRVTDSATLSALKSVTKNWVSYGYCSGAGSYTLGSESPTEYMKHPDLVFGDYMKYADLTYGGVRYRAVTFSNYRPFFSNCLRTADYSNQDDNGYMKGIIYYFRYEPLIWRVLDPTSGYVMCESIIDAQAYQNAIYKKDDEYYQGKNSSLYANNYATCSLRTWLNNTFYDTAFTQKQKSNI